MDTNRILDLVAKMQQGDQESFTLLYEEFSDRIYKYIRIKLPSDQEAEDVLQEVFVKTWQGSKKLQLDGLNLSAWLYKIAGNTINDHSVRQILPRFSRHSEICHAQKSCRNSADHRLLHTGLDFRVWISGRSAGRRTR